MKFIQKLLTTITIVILLTGTTSFAQGLPSAKNPEEVGLSSERLNKIGPVIEAEIAQGNIPGAVVLVARKGRVAYIKSFGKTSDVSGMPMKNDSIFRLYSMTKPITSVGIMMLNEEGKLLLNDPVSKYIPELGKLKVCVEKTDPETKNVFCELVPSARDITIQDLLRHTSGLVYGIFGNGPVHKLYRASDASSKDASLKESMTTLSKLPLAFQPGTAWEYGVSVDVLGRVIEVVSGMPLDRFIAERITGPLGMKDTAFFVEKSKLNRFSEGNKHPQTGLRGMYDVTAQPKVLSGGAGLVSTAMDYARFAQMLLNGGKLDGVRLLSPKTVKFMTSDAKGDIPSRSAFLPAGYTFGLGFGIRVEDGISYRIGSKGDYYWPGIAGSSWSADPKEDLIFVVMLEDLKYGPGGRYTTLLRTMVYQALIN